MQVRKDSTLEDLQAPFSKPALVIEPFLLEVPVNKANKELGMAYNTAYKIYNKIREAIYQFVKEDDMLSGEVEMDESYFGGKRAGKRGRGAEGKMSVLGLLEREGRVKVEVVKDGACPINPFQETFSLLFSLPPLHSIHHTKSAVDPYLQKYLQPCRLPLPTCQRLTSYL